MNYRLYVVRFDLNHRTVVFALFESRSYQREQLSR